MIPAAPTSARRCFSGNAEAAEASTNGTGTSSSRLMPVSRTSPPQAFTAIPCPSSCTVLTSGYRIHMSSRNSGVSMWTEANARIGAQLVPADSNPSSTTTTHAASDSRMHQRTPQRREPLEQLVGIEQRHAERQRVEHGDAALAVLLEAPPEQLGDVGRDLTLQQVVVAQLAEDLDGLVLGRRVLAELVEQRVPDLVGRALAVHPADEVEGVLVHPVVAAGAGVLQQVPDLAAIDVARHAHVAAQPRVNAGDAVPAGAE